jgi:hypothetical protein
VAEAGIPSRRRARPHLGTHHLPAQPELHPISEAVSEHEAIEEEHFWPAVRRALPDGDRWADGALEQEQQGSRTLAELLQSTPDTEEFDELVSSLMPQLHQHVAYEEHLFLQLRETMSSDDLDELGETLRRAKKN